MVSFETKGYGHKTQVAGRGRHCDLTHVHTGALPGGLLRASRCSAWTRGTEEPQTHEAGTPLPHHTESRRGFPRGPPSRGSLDAQPAPAVGSCRPPSTPWIRTQLQGQQAVLTPQHPHFCKQGCRTPAPTASFLDRWRGVNSRR